jgi:ssDNA-binding Zn-finger/Zn-ribbon topoisomerase 1
MNQFKYTLDKSSKKFTCPKCNKKTFVKYIETETGNYQSEDFGRCDRETNCGFHASPKGELNKMVDFVAIPKPETSFHDYNLVSQSRRNFKQNNFVQFLKTLFTESEVNKAIERYLLGTSKQCNGATIFWQIDNNEKVRHGKIMLYNPETGKRVKDQYGKGIINSVRSVLKLKDFNLNQCLFGLHLINETNQKTIALVESEKTSIIMSIFKPQYTWLATGSKSGLKYDFLKPIKDYKIIAFPDKSEFSDWSKKAIDLNNFGFDIRVNNWLEQQNNYEAGIDLADVFMRELKKVEIDYSDSELTINEIEQHTPEIWELIKAFDLVDNRNYEIRKVIK